MGKYRRWDAAIAGRMEVKIRGEDGVLMFVHFVKLLLVRYI